MTGLAVAFFGMLTLFLVLDFQWDLPSVVRAGWYTAPGIVPAGVAVILLLQGVTLSARALRAGGSLERRDLRKIKAAALKSAAARRAATAMLLLAVYVFGLVGRVHFILASFLFLAAFMFVFRAGRWVRILLISALTALAISLVFEGIARVPLP